MGVTPAGAEYLKPVPNDYLQRWPVSKRVNSSKADADDPALIEPVEWWDTKGTLNLPPVVFSAPTKSPRQKVLIASGATQAATV